MSNHCVTRYYFGVNKRRLTLHTGTRKAGIHGQTERVVLFVLILVKNQVQNLAKCKRDSRTKGPIPLSTKTRKKTRLLLGSLS